MGQAKQCIVCVPITSISDEELHTVHGLDDFPPQIWIRLREKFDRRSEAEAETAFMSFLDFAHLESETADELLWSGMRLLFSAVPIKVLLLMLTLV